MHIIIDEVGQILRVYLQHLVVSDRPTVDEEDGGEKHDDPRALTLAEDFQHQHSVQEEPMDEVFSDQGSGKESSHPHGHFQASKLPIARISTRSRK